MVRYVAGDIGGTNSRLQLMELPEEKDGSINQELEAVIAEETYPSQQYASLTFVIQKFLNTVRAPLLLADALCWREGQPTLTRTVGALCSTMRRARPRWRAAWQ